MISKEYKINIIGAGLAGLSAAKTLAEQGIPCRLISVQPSERAQSNLAEGGINGVLDVMGDQDTVEEHFRDTMKGGYELADPAMVRGMVEAAPDIIRELESLGVPFHRQDGHIMQRYFGGQKKRRTAYAQSSTGKMLMAALIDEVRKYEVQGLVERYCNHKFAGLLLENATYPSEESSIAGRDRINFTGRVEIAFAGQEDIDFAGREESTLTGRDQSVSADRDKSNPGKICCIGVEVMEGKNEEITAFNGPVIMACGGPAGMFYGNTTGTTANSGAAAALLFLQGVPFSNLEFLQFHPTTVQIPGKRLLISEAARGEGGRLFVYGGAGEKHFFMEEKYGERGNLMPRDVVSAEMVKTGKPVYLDMTGLTGDVWSEKLADLRREVTQRVGIDPAKEPVPVEPGIHFFMGGIQVDANHRAGIPGLYAAGECAAAYHGANRLGGNSLLGAIYGGKKAALTAKDEYGLFLADKNESSLKRSDVDQGAGVEEPFQGRTGFSQKAEGEYILLREEEVPVARRLEKLLFEGMGIFREEEGLKKALAQWEDLWQRALGPAMEDKISAELQGRFLLGKAMLLSALERRESRGAHRRKDFPELREKYGVPSVAKLEDKTQKGSRTQGQSETQKGREKLTEGGDPNIRRDKDVSDERPMASYRRILRILRRETAGAEAYWESFSYHFNEPAATVATALEALREKDRVEADHPWRPLVWEHSCLQEKCGACAMVINGHPALACGVKLLDCKGETITVEPLKKFPVIADLLVDRSLMRERLKEVHVWLEGEASHKGNTMAFEASRCLQCGLCLEVCPNYAGEGVFAGMGGMMPLARLVAKAPESQRKQLEKDYSQRVYADCGKSLACRKVCPVGERMEDLLTLSNAAAVWKRWNKV